MLSFERHQVSLLDRSFPRLMRQCALEQILGFRSIGGFCRWTRKKEQGNRASTF